MLNKTTFSAAFAFAMALSFSGASAFANDGGVAAIKVKDIRVREYKPGSRETELRRISAPNFKITFRGGEAAKLQKVLPSTVTVLTATQPEIKDQFNETFKHLAIYNEKTAQVSAKMINIDCNNGELVANGSEGKVRIDKKAETECTISITQETADSLGDIQVFEPVCK